MTKNINCNDTVEQKLDKLISVVCGDMEKPEDSIAAKVNILFNERKERRDFNRQLTIWFAGFLVSFIISVTTLSFYLGNQDNRINNLEYRINQMQQIKGV